MRDNKKVTLIRSAVTSCSCCGKMTDTNGSHCEYCGDSNFLSNE